MNQKVDIFAMLLFLMDLLGSPRETTRLCEDITDLGGLLTMETRLLMGKPVEMNLLVTESLREARPKGYPDARFL